MRRWSAVAVVVVVAVVALIGCGGGEAELDESSAVRVAAFDFAESEVLAEIYAQALEARGVRVDRLGVVGPREIVAPALQLGEIDVVPEYVGSAAAHYGAEGDDLASLRAAVRNLGLEALEPSPARDVNVLVVTAQTAREHDVVRVSDLVDLAPTARLGGPVECPDRPLCLLGLRDTYGIEFDEFVPQPSLVLAADALRRGEIDVAVMFSTSAPLVERDLVVLDDDLELQPVDNVVPLVRTSAFERWGSSSRRALDGVSAALTTVELRALNARVDRGESLEQVAASWLADVPTDGS